MNKVSFDKNKCISNIVFMGIGEPFLNYNNLIGAIDILTHSAAANIASRHITISTAGVIPSIKRLAGYKKQIKLSISLHSAIDKKRSVLVPLNKKYNINSLIEAAKYYIGKTGKLITFEYVLIKGINDTQEDIKRLAGVLKGVACKVNVIPYNKIEGLEFEATPHKDVKYFINTLLKNDIKVTGRLRKGHDINSGCGQLKALFCLGV
jgi:23S rRNA (adenine2503-C2)-methyltransferase